MIGKVIWHGGDVAVKEIHFILQLCMPRFIRTNPIILVVRQGDKMSCLAGLGSNLAPYTQGTTLLLTHVITLQIVQGVSHCVCVVIVCLCVSVVFYVSCNNVYLF